MHDAKSPRQAPVALPGQPADQTQQTKTPSWGPRAWQIMKPLVNVTMFLAIILLLVMLWFVQSTQAFYDNVMHSVKFDVIEEMDTDVKALTNEMQAGVDDLDDIRAKLIQLVDHPPELMSPEMLKDIRLIRDDTQRIAHDLERIASGHVNLSQETLERVSAALVRAYVDIRGCAAKPANQIRQSAEAPILDTESR